MTTCRFCDRIHDRPSYSDLEPYRFHWTHVIQFVVGIVLVYGLFMALIIIGTAAS